MMKIAFTICSNNYIAHAKALAESLLKHNPDYKFFIGLVDELSKEIDYSTFVNVVVIPVRNLGIDGIDGLITKYNIIEFNTAVKPFYFQHFFKTYNPEHVLYLDPDIVVYQRFKEMDEKLQTFSFLLTPHFLKISPQVEPPHERLVLNVGLFNLGFLGVRNDENGKVMMEWFGDRMRKYCYYDFHNGLFVDQIWANFIPLYFENHHILRSPGYNMGYWNLSERTLSKDQEGAYCVNDSNELIFFHFSGYNPTRPDILSKWSAHSFEDKADVKGIFTEYTSVVLANDYIKTSQIAPALQLKPIARSFRERVGLKLQSISSGVLNYFFRFNTPRI